MKPNCGLSTNNAEAASPMQKQHHLQLVLLLLQVSMLRLQGKVEVLQISLTLARSSLS